MPVKKIPNDTKRERRHDPGGDMAIDTSQLHLMPEEHGIDLNQPAANAEALERLNKYPASCSACPVHKSDKNPDYILGSDEALKFLHVCFDDDMGEDGRPLSDDDMQPKPRWCPRNKPTE